jgi:hypothetical protein
MNQKQLLERLVQVTKRPTPVQQAPQADSVSMYLLKQLMDKITWVKGDKGDRGDRGMIGLRGLTGPKGDSIVGPMGPRGPQGPQGKSIVGPPGPAGRDGLDGTMNTGEMIELSEKAVAKHEERHDHNPFLLGTKIVDESGIGKDKLLSFNGQKLVYVDPPKTEKGKSIHIPASGGTGDRFRVRTVTENYNVDPGDQIVHVNAESGDITVTFYSAVSNDGRHVYIKRVDASDNTVTLAFQGAETWEFELTDQLPNRGSGRDAYCHDNNWFIKSTS